MARCTPNRWTCVLVWHNDNPNQVRAMHAYSSEAKALEAIARFEKNGYRRATLGSYVDCLQEFRNYADTSADFRQTWVSQPQRKSIARVDFGHRASAVYLDSAAHDFVLS